MKINNKNKSAQPLTWIEKVPTDSYGHTKDVIRLELGLTKREYFAGLAMQGFVTNPFFVKNGNRMDIVKDSIKFADELLSQLENETNS